VNLFDLPLWLSGTILVVGLSGFSLGAEWIVRRHLMPRLHMRPHEAEYPSTVIASVMVFYGLIAALVAITVWERHTLVGERAAGEATAIAMLWRDVGGYPPLEREALRSALRAYTEYVIDEAWPEYRKGRIPSEGVDKLDNFQATLFTFEPASESQRALHANALRVYDQLVQMRRLRLDAVGTGLPGVLWFLVICGALISLVVALFFPVEDGRYQGILVVSLSCLMALVILVILALDQPFRGDLGISPESFRLVHDHLMTR